MSSDARPRLMELPHDERQRLVERLLKNRRSGAGPQEIVRHPRQASAYPMSFPQQRIWLLHQLLPATSTFSVPYALRLRGPLDRGALERSIQDLIERHESLRTTFDLVDGRPSQRVSSPARLAIRYDDLGGLPDAEREPEAARQAREETRRPWDLSAGPLVRVRLWGLGPDDHAFLFLLHHIICDGWSLGVLARELTACYSARADGRAPSLPEAPIQYVDYSVWQRRWVESDQLGVHLANWRRRMAGTAPLVLPVHPKDAGRGAERIAARVMLPPGLTQRLKAFSQAEGVTPFMLLLAAFGALLSRYSGQAEFAVGSPVANRNRAELENLVGCFMNPLPFRLDLRGNPTFRDLVRRVRATALDVYADQDVPFDLLVRALDPRHQSSAPPLYQAMLLFHNLPWEGRALAGASLRVAGWRFLADEAQEAGEPISADVFPLSLQLVESGGAIAGVLEYSGEFDTVLSGMPAEFPAFLERALLAPERPAADLASPPDTVSLTLGDGAQWIEAEPVHEAFEAQVRRTPAAAALVEGGQALTYGELGARVNRLAGHLTAAGAGPDVPVGVLLERSADAVAAVLAILRAGAGYLPLDPALPRERLARMLDRAGAPIVVTRGDLLRDREIDDGIFEGRVVVRLDADAGAIARQPPDGPATHARPDHLAYLLYTSGSSGEPKAVAIPRRALANYVRFARERFELTPADRVLQFASLAFDTAAEEIFPTLTSGATLVLRDETALTSVPAFLDACAAWGVSVLDLPTAYWHELTAQIARGGLTVPASLRLVILGGERALPARVQEWRAAAGPRVCLLNTYGPTETTIVATTCDLTHLADGEPPIGRPIAHAQALILDASGRPVPAGTVGELCIGGMGLARGYLNDPALTAARFVPHPGGSPGARVYRTGDLARLRPDGHLEFAGRLDNQVKLRGYRIEPGEVEAVLCAHPAVLEAAVVLRGAPGGDPRLVAYVIGFEGASLDRGALRRFLQERLPAYMVPSDLVSLDRLPRTIQNKIDRRALAALAVQDTPDETYVAPQNEMESKVAGLWSEVLRRERVGVQDNFFDLGGHSLLVVQLHGRLRETFGADLSLVDLFRYPTVRTQAARLAAAPAGNGSAANAARDRAARQRQAFQRQRSASRQDRGERC